MESAILALEDGSIFKGVSIGASGATVGEVVFNTSMTGYQEILSDPSYAEQIITLTYPHIGNTGTNDEDMEAKLCHAKGLVIKEPPLLMSSWRSQSTLTDFLVAHNIVAIADIDTRKLTRLLREKGSLAGCIIVGEASAETASAQAQAFPGLKGMDLAKQVSTKEPYLWNQGSWSLENGYQTVQNPRFKVVAYDFGAKLNILRLLADEGCEVHVVPAQTPAEEVLAMNPDGIFLSNGPGDPEPCDYAIAATKTFLDKKIPVFGICLGHQLLALACGAKTHKMINGHHGANHPVQDLNSGRVVITSQNHGFCVDKDSLPEFMQVTHTSLFDQTIQGVRHKTKPAFSFQGHPEASPGPQDIGYLFKEFAKMMGA